MVEHLRLRWRDDLSVEALLGLRDELHDMLGRIRSMRHIANPVFKCPACGHIGRGADPPRQCSRHDIGAGSLRRGRERTGTGA
jgi:hypothetical protein